MADFAYHMEVLRKARIIERARQAKQNQVNQAVLEHSAQEICTTCSCMVDWSSEVVAEWRSEGTSRSPHSHDRPWYSSPVPRRPGLP